ncbi:unnamed protein product [Cyclocybe aegerita]|uniref:Uncharacterized protein n=1 Tax=Cyclocybe aegerita TaxID=1973307 RepID=A0A8S0W568_CYCAE|nr:unnamed protein product [Cyclocybe aegerita]
MSTTDPIPQSSAEGSAVETERRQQADPLPSKVGEIGFQEGVHAVRDRSQDVPGVVLPARHPADRGTPSPTSDAVPSADSPIQPSTPSQDAASPPESIVKSSSLLGFLKPDKTIGGLHLTTILIFLLQLSLFAGTIVAWVFATRLLLNVGNDGQRLPGGQSSAVFVHVVFVIAIIGQLIFLERRLFRLRGERYSHLHPGELLPRHRSGPTPHTGIAFAPWNRPPLPTYAAALAQSGAGTGDVEDHLIAAPPPPAYGNTRGSTLLLAGFLRDSLRAQRPQSATSQSAPTPTSRPLSYVSRDEQWEEIQNADRALRLEETLSRLEAPRPVTTRS